VLSAPPSSPLASGVKHAPERGVWLLRWIWPGSPVVPLTIITVLLTIGAVGFSYYLLPLRARVRDPLHAWFKPSGIVGQTAGFVTLALFLFMWLYPLRKRWRLLAGKGAMSGWLNVHILAGLTIPWVGALHAGWRFEGLIGLGYVAMVVVSASGVVGKYLYARIPRSRAGAELTLEQVESERNALVTRIASALAVPAAEVQRTLAEFASGRTGQGTFGALLSMATADIQRWRASAALRRRWGAIAGRRLEPAALREVVRLARRQIAVTQALRMLDATHRVFRYWHVAHLPVAITAFVAVLIHVAVAVAMGMTWLG